MENIIQTIKNTLSQNADPKIQESSKRFFKEKVTVYGSNTAFVVKLAKESFKKVKDKPKEEIFKLCEELWQSGYMEESFIACNWSYLIEEQYEEEDIKVFEKWINKYVSNWASCDTLCNHSVGTLIDKFPQQISYLKKWAKSDNRWTRRAAAVTLIIPARHGKFLTDIFEIANILLTDKDDLVQKGYGWMLKAASQAYPQEVYNYVLKNKQIMPRTALRYAIEKLPKEMKAEAISKK